MIEEMVNQVMETTSQYHNIPKEDLIGPRRHQYLIMARHKAAKYAMEYTGASLKTVGHYIGKRDHSTMIHSQQAFSALYDTDKKFKRDAIKLKALLNASFFVNANF